MQRFNRTTLYSWIRRAVGVAIGCVVMSVFIPGCGVGYVVRSAYFQAELLASRTPIDEVLAEDRLNATQRNRLSQVADIKQFGEEMGLKPTNNYGTIAMDWNRKIWNLSACPPLSFQPKTWRFPILGRVPYLGFFRRQDADKWEKRLHDQGYEVYVRTAGAYSTLGWFRDPILVPMLEWDTFQLADTVLHELVHATLWIPGSVKFNESFANFVGEEAAFRYLKSRFGTNSSIHVHAVEQMEDLDRWRAVLRQLYADLEAVYKDTDLDDAAKQHKKTALFASLQPRVESGNFHDTARFVAATQSEPWNNARLMQYRTYNHNRDRFQKLLDEQDGNLLAFIDQIQEIKHKQKKPFQALENAAKSTPETRLQ